MVRKQKKGLTQIAHTAAVCEWLSGNVKVRPETCNVGRICESYGLNTAKPLQQKACDLDKLWGKFYQAIMLNQDKVSLYSSLPCCLGQLYLPYPSWNFSIIFSHELPVDIRNVQRPGWVVESNTFFYTDTRCGTISSWWRWWRSKNVTESSNAFCRYFFHFSSLMAFAGLATFLHAFPWSVRQDACWMPTGQLCHATTRCILEDSQYTGWFGCVGGTERWKPHRRRQYIRRPEDQKTRRPEG